MENDPSKVWGYLVKSFPPGHFDGILEDMYGGNITAEQQVKLQEEMELTH